MLDVLSMAFYFMQNSMSYLYEFHISIIFSGDSTGFYCMQASFKFKFKSDLVIKSYHLDNSVLN